jgi:glycosyltransferase involved in cell wall biosynthesis
LSSCLVIIAPDLRTGGSVGGVALRHAIAMNASRDVHVITRAVPPDLPAGICPIIVRPSGWNWMRRYCHVPNELAFVLSARRALKALAATTRIDAVWCHGHATAALAAAPLKRRFGFRLVMTTHGDIFDRPAGTYSRELTWLYRKVTPVAYRAADYVQALSPYMANLAVRHGARGDRVRVIPNGVDPDDLGAAHLAPRLPSSFRGGGALHLLYVGSLWRVKGADVLLEAAAQLQREAGCAVELSLIGDGPERATLKALAVSLRLAGTAFHGHVPRCALGDHYRSADILCVPSRSEALSTAALEAMLCGVPVVGSRTGGIPFIVEDGVNGYLAAPEDAVGLAGCIKRAGISKEHLAQLGARGFATARERFTWRAVTEQLDHLLREAHA